MTLNERLDLAKKIVLIVGPLSVAIWTVLEFSTTATMEVRKPFLKRQLDLCFEAVATTSRLATSSHGADWEKARNRFWELYWGELAVVENAAVALTMVKFGAALKKFQAGESNTILRGPSINVAHECRALIRKSWGVSLLPLDKSLFDENLLTPIK